VWYFVISIIFHLGSTLFVFLLAKKLTKNIYIAFSASLLFGIHRLSSQAVTWFAASLGAELSTLFLLLSFILYLYYLDKKKISIFIVSIITYLFSIFSKETSLSLVIFFPFIYLVYKNKEISRSLLKDKEIRKTVFYPLFLGLFFLFKLILLVINPLIPTGVVVKPEHTSVVFLYLKILFYPLLALAQIFDWNSILFSASKEFLLSEYPDLAHNAVAPHLIETLAPDILYLLASFVLLTIVVWLYPKFKKINPKLTSVFILSGIGFFISILPYVPLPRFTTFLEPRYYYTPNIFAALMLSIFIYLFFQKAFRSNIAEKLMVIIVILIAIVNYQNIQIDLASRIQIAQQRKTVLYQFKVLMPHLPVKDSVIFVTGTGSDYLIPDLKVPFQSGFGNVLMVWYNDPHYLKPQILDNGFLYQLNDQGYQKIGNYGFGYYYQKPVLLKDVQAKKFNLSQVYGFSWDESHQKLYNITESLRKELQLSIHEEN
ncbi:MAG TPA: hypothetical protein VF820_00365, partial [Patescibacteria group bacterium]